ncbi:hypothetical protein BC938DRAFT_477801, partial [Jimgerdemannia flammicorona]
MQAVAQVVVGKSENKGEGFRWAALDHRHHKQMYRLTGPELMDGEEIARVINETVRPDKEVRFEPVSRGEMRRVLEKLRDEGGRGRGGNRVAQG